MKRKGLVITALIVLVLIVGLIYAYQNLGNIAQTILEKELPGLKFEKLDVGLHKVEVTGVEYASKSKKARISANSISISPSLSSLLSNTFEVSDITIEKPAMLARKRAGREGLELPVPTMEKSEQTGASVKKETTAQEKGKKATERSIHIAKIRINQGKGEFVDESVPAGPARFEIADVNIAAEDIYAPSRPGRMPLDLKLKVPAKRQGTVALNGAVDRTDRSGDLHLQISNLFLPLLAPYYKDQQVTLNLADGQFSADTKVVMQQGKYKVTGFVQLSDLKVDGGQFYGISAAQLQQYLEKHPEPIKVDLAIEGDLDKPGSMRRSIMETIVKALLKQFGGARLEGAKQKLKEGDIEGAKQELKDLKRELKDMFKRR